MPSRHDSAAAPLAFGGRLFIQGENVLMAHDAFNGLELWRRELPGASRLHTQGGAPGNLTGGGSNLFVVVGDRCLRLDTATGATTKEYSPPAAALTGVVSGQWSYVTFHSGLLFGSISRRTDWGAYEEGALFALDAVTGAAVWALTNRQITAGTLALDGGRAWFVDRRIAEEQRRAALAQILDPPRRDRRGQPVPPDVRLAVCLDARSGATLWEQPLYVGDCLGEEVGDLTGMAAQGVYLLCGQPWNGHFWKEFLAGAFSRRSLIALDAATGRPLWSDRKGYRSRPLIVGETIVAEPWAYELRTGKPIERRHPLTGEPSAWQMSRPGHHCGNIAAAAETLFCRSGSLAYYDLAADFGTAHFGAQRPGCWINCIPANGLALMPEASAGCVCPYALQCTIALRPRRTNRAWGVFSAAGASIPIRRLNLNFGAPGDRRDAAGELWLAYPRPYAGRLVTEVPVQSAALTNAEFACREGAATDNWIGQSWWSGVTNLSVLLHDDTDGAIPVTVRLHFREPDGLLPSQRVFAVAIEGDVRLPAFDPAREGGGTNTVVREFRDLRVTGPLNVALIPVRGLPLLCGLEAIREPDLPQVADSSVACTAGVPAILTLPATFEDGAAMAATITVVTPPAHGVLTRLSGRRYAYRANPAYSGSDVIVWRAAEAGRETRAAMVTITVEPDRTAPRPLAARSTGLENRVALDFDEPLDPATATNAVLYRVDKDVGVYEASLRTNGTSVYLTTAPLKEGESYSVTVRGVRDRASPPNVATNAGTVTFTHTLAGFALRELWRGVTGAEMTCFTNGALARKPDATEEVASLESPGTETGDNYAARISGFIRPRVTAEYVFWCAADDACELWLAPDATPAHRVRVAHAPAWTLKRQWDKFPEQKSKPIPLKAGECYSFEVRHKEAAGGDHVSVAWEAPGVPRAVIPGSCLLLPRRP
jgi:outer membrane protein assembly factor BamB